MFRVRDHCAARPGGPLAGRQVALRPLHRREIRVVRSWLADPEIVRLAFGLEAPPALLGRLARDYMSELFSGPRVALAIDDLEGRLIGLVNYTMRRDAAVKAKIGILIGEKARWGRGCGTDALDTLLRFLFAEGRVDLVELDTAVFNERAQRCFQRCGFAPTGRMTEVNLLDGVHCEKIWMSLSRESYLRQ